MNMTDYRNMVANKAAPPHHVDGIQFHLLHCCLGLATEYLEFEIAPHNDNVIEELGDFLWYMALGANTLDLDFLPSDNLPSNQKTLIEFPQKLEEFLSTVKKDIIYQNTQLLIPSYLALWKTFRSVLSVYHTTVDQLMEANTAKLNARYIDKFTTTESAERKDKNLESNN